MKNTFKSIVILMIAVTWLPTGVSDFLIIPLIIKEIGLQMYIIISILLLIYLYNTIEGKTISSKLNTIKREVASLW